MLGKGMRIFNKLRTWARTLRTKRNKRRAFMAALALAVIAIIYMDTPTISPSAYRPLLDVIAKGESKGNYNAYFGNGANTDIKFTEMTIAQVLQWQQDYVNQGKASNAVGRYQFLGTTLRGLIQRLNIDPQARFDPAMQDRLAIALIERRGVMAYYQNRIGWEEFAANLAKEWASLPKISPPNPQQSYYAEDGLNKALVSIQEIKTAIERLKQ
jgi:conjugal transfer mating pair stabilization protein TraG